MTPYRVKCISNRHVTRTLNIGDHYTVIRRRGRYVDLAELAHIRLGGMAVERFRKVGL